MMHAQRHLDELLLKEGLFDDGDDMRGGDQE
jgi:hypothetical protein